MIGSQRFERAPAGSVDLAQEKLSQPLRLRFQHQLRRPHLGPVALLRTGEAVDVGAMLGDIDEQAKIDCDHLRFVFGPPALTIFGVTSVRARARQPRSNRGFAMVAWPMA